MTIGAAKLSSLLGHECLKSALGVQTGEAIHLIIYLFNYYRISTLEDKYSDHDKFCFTNLCLTLDDKCLSFFAW